MGKPRGKASRESHRSLDPREGKPDTSDTAREESARACPHSRQGLTPLGRLQKYPKIHVALERNPQVPAPNPHKIIRPGIDGRGILRDPEQLAWGLTFPEATIVSREHLPQLEKMQEVLPSRRDEAHFR